MALSKTKFIAGKQCKKLLWCMVNDPDGIPKPRPLLARAYRRGNAFGNRAKKQFHGGVEVDNWRKNFGKGLSRTSSLIESRTAPIFEAGVSIDGLTALADVLNPVGANQWDLIEVKNSYAVKEVFIHDIAFQRHCYQSAGISIRKCFVLHRQRPRFKWLSWIVKSQQVEVTALVDDVSVGLEKEILACHNTINEKTCPLVLPGDQCQKPYKCRMYEVCNSEGR